MLRSVTGRMITARPATTLTTAICRHTRHVIVRAHEPSQPHQQPLQPQKQQTASAEYILSALKDIERDFTAYSKDMCQRLDDMIEQQSVTNEDMSAMSKMTDDMNEQLSLNLELSRLISPRRNRLQLEVGERAGSHATFRTVPEWLQRLAVPLQAAGIPPAVAQANIVQNLLKDDVMVRAAMRGLGQRMHSTFSQLMTLDNFAWANTAAEDALQPADAAVLAAANQDSSLEELHQAQKALALAADWTRHQAYTAMLVRDESYSDVDGCKDEYDGRDEDEAFIDNLHEYVRVDVSTLSRAAVPQVLRLCNSVNSCRQGRPEGTSVLLVPAQTMWFDNCSEAFNCEALAGYLAQLLQHHKDGLVSPQLISMLTSDLGSGCPFTLLVTGGRAAALEYYGQGETIVGPDTLTHTLYHKGTTSTGYTKGVRELLCRSDALMQVWDLATTTADPTSPGAAAPKKLQTVEAFLVCAAGERLAVPPSITLGRTHISARVM